jgi:hypothetical protein
MSSSPDPRGLAVALRWLSGLGALSMLAAALVGAAAVARFGPPLAMGLALYGGETEPLLPALPYPWSATALLGALVGAGLLLERRGRALPGALLAHGAALLALALPFWQLARLHALTR